MNLDLKILRNFPNEIKLKLYDGYFAGRKLARLLETMSSCNIAFTKIYAEKLYHHKLS